MKFSVVNKAFNDKIKVLSDFSFRDQRGWYIRIKSVDEGSIEIQTENTINACEIDIFAKVIEEGDIVLPFSELHHVVASCNTNDLTFESDNDYLHVYSQDDEQNFEYQIKLVHLQVEPIEWPTSQIFGFNAYSFTTILKTAASFASTDDSRAYLCGINVENIDNSLRVSATDGRRACRSMLMKNGKEEKDVAPFKAFTIPTKFAKIIIKNMATLKEDIIIKIGSNCISVYGDRMVMHSTLIREQFPKIDKFFQYEPAMSLVVSNSSLFNSVTRASACKDKTNGVFLELDTNAVTVSAESETKKVTDTIDAHFNGKKMAMSFSFDYLLDLLSAYCGDVINIGIMAKDKPIIAEDDMATYVLMPRVQS